MHELQICVVREKWYSFVTQTYCIYFENVKSYYKIGLFKYEVNSNFCKKLLYINFKLTDFGIRKPQQDITLTVFTGPGRKRACKDGQGQQKCLW